MDEFIRTKEQLERITRYDRQNTDTSPTTPNTKIVATLTTNNKSSEQINCTSKNLDIGEFNLESFSLPDMTAFKNPVLDSFNLPDMTAFKSPVLDSFNLSDMTAFKNPVLDSFNLPDMTAFKVFNMDHLYGWQNPSKAWNITIPTPISELVQLPSSNFANLMAELNKREPVQFASILDQISILSSSSMPIDSCEEIMETEQDHSENKSSIPSGSVRNVLSNDYVKQGLFWIINITFISIRAGFDPQTIIYDLIDIYINSKAPNTESKKEEDK